MSLAMKREKKYTFQDYVTWPDEERWEIIDGVAYNMSPAPKVRHQRIVSWLNYALTGKLKKCEHFIAPTDVVFDETNVVQPDIFVVCDKNKVTEDNIQGAPDLIIEVVSPGTEVKDRREKKNLYERHGVKEYILIYPDREYAESYCLGEGGYGAPDIFNRDETLKLSLFEIEINLRELFEKAGRGG